MTKKDYIKKWIENALTKTVKVNPNSSTSYGLKHYCEQSIGYYVSNEEMKENMKELGFLFEKCNRVNEYYNISIVVNKVVFTQKLGNQYKDIDRSFHVKAKEIKV